MKPEIHHLHNEPLAEWLTENVEAGTRIGFDALLMTNADYEDAVCDDTV